jgi:5-methylcytosine-specific restriction endonuclease McrA
MTYKEQLRDPRWQRVQSLIRERDKYKCRICGDASSFLHVHHIYYQNGLKAWEYDHDSMITLCESCHEFAHKSLPKISALMTVSLANNKMDFISIEEALRKIIGEKTNHIVP